MNRARHRKRRRSDRDGHRHRLRPLAVAEARPAAGGQGRQPQPRAGRSRPELRPVPGPHRAEPQALRPGRPGAAGRLRRVRLHGPRLQGQAPAAALAAARRPDRRAARPLQRPARHARRQHQRRQLERLDPLARAAHRMYVQVQLYNDAGSVPMGASGPGTSRAPVDPRSGGTFLSPDKGLRSARPLVHDDRRLRCWALRCPAAALRRP